MSLGITVIDHVQIAVPKALEAQALAFYRGVLGLTEIPKPEELRARGGAWFQTGNLQMHVGFLVKDLAAARAEIVSKGVTIEEESVAARSFTRKQTCRLLFGEATGSR